MIVVAIIGVLAALAIYGVRKYLAASKTGEAKQTVGEITRTAAAAYEREISPSESMAEGGTSMTFEHLLCESAIAVPAVVPPGTKYQPLTGNGVDFHTGNAQVGWWCLRFSMNQPIIYQYWYSKNASPAAPGNPAKCTADCFEAAAIGDTNGNGAFSRFATTGSISSSKELKTASAMYVDNEAE